MNEVCRKVLFILCIYLLLMFIVGGTSNLFSLDNGNEQYVVKYTENNKTKNQEQPKETITATDYATSYQKELPFDFSVNITEKQTKQKQNIAFSFLFVDIPHYDVYEELEKRKCKFIYQRKFALCILKQKIKHLKPHKWRIKEDKLCL